jgi:ubiquitin-activating enzyme E1
VDPAPTRLCDTGVNFFLSEADVGLPRAEAVLPRLHELNPLCKLKLADQLTEAVIRSHKVLIITEPRPLTDLIALNELCRSINVAFYYAFVGGMCMSVFVDLGLKHTIFDPNGEKPVQKLITDIVSLHGRYANLSIACIATSSIGVSE